MFLNDNQHFYVYLYWGKSQIGHICPMLANQYPKIFSIFYIHFFLFKCILLQISHKKCFIINIFILGHSGVNDRVSATSNTF